MQNQEAPYIDDETVRRFQQLGFGEEETLTALLCFEGDVERAASWLVEQPREPEPPRERLAPQPPVPLGPVNPAAVPREPLAPSADGDRRRLLAARALQREAQAKRERRAKEEARLRDLKAQEQAEIDRKRARARLAAEKNQAAALKAEELARAGRPTHADAAEGRVGRAGRSVPQAGPSAAAVPVEPQTQQSVLSPAHRTREAPLTPPQPAAAAQPCDAPAMPERKLRMLLQQETGVAAGEAAQVAELCAARGVLASEPLILDVSPAGIEMRALMLESARATLKGTASAASSAMAETSTLPSVPPTSPPPPSLQQESAEQPAPMPPPTRAIASKPEPSARDLIVAQDEEFAAALASDQRAEAIAAARIATAAAEIAKQVESAGTTAVASDVAEEEPVVVLSAQEMRERRIAALERRAAAEQVE